MICVHKQQDKEMHVRKTRLGRAFNTSVNSHWAQIREGHQDGFAFDGEHQDNTSQAASTWRQMQLCNCTIRIQVARLKEKWYARYCVADAWALRSNLHVKTAL
jgi:hypothetical protein